MELATRKQRQDECIGIAQAITYLSSSVGREGGAATEVLEACVRERYARLMEAVTAYAPDAEADVERDAFRRYVTRRARETPGLVERIWKA